MKSRHPISHQIIIILSLFLIFLMVSSNQSSAIIAAYLDTPTGSDSDIDANSNIGNDGSTSYLDAQAIGGNNQTITESNTYDGTHIEDPIDNDVSDIDSSPDNGNLTNFAQSQSLDSNYANFTEELNNYNSVDLSSNEYFLVGGGTDATTSFGSTSGTIEMWLKFDVSASGRAWGQNNNFEVRTASGAFTLDFGFTTALAGNKANWVVGNWYFIAFTWDEIGDDLWLYWGDEITIPTIDSSNTNWTSEVSTLPNSDNRIFNSHGADDPIDGHLDEFRYWDTERTLTEIRDDYDTILTGSESGLQHYYQFENDLTDSAGSADLTPAGIGTYVFSTDLSLGLTDGYQLDQEVQFTNLIDFMEFENISIYTGSNGTETLEVSYWNGSDWSQLFSDLNANSWNNVSISFIGSTFTLKFGALYSGSDSVQDYWEIDVILFVYEGEGTKEDYIDQESDVDSSPDKGTESAFANMQATDTILNILTETNATTQYELEQEMQFINVINPTLPLIQVSIKTGNLDGEALKVQYWDGGQWKQIAAKLLANSWNNLTVTDFVTTSIFTIRFIDGTKNNDQSTQDVWEIDSVLLSHISRNNHFELDWEHQAQGIDITKEFYVLTINGYSSDTTEDFQVQLWNQTSSSWQTSFSLTITSLQQWYNYTIPSSDLLGSIITWRYAGTKDGSINLFDTSQNTLHIAYAGIASYEELPTIQINPADLEYNEGTTGNTLDWTVTDSNPTTYTVYLDDVPGTPTAWNSGVPISYNVDGLAKGTHNVTIVVSDISDNIASDYVLVTVTDNLPPVISSPDDFSYEAGITGNNITWIATDFNANTYEIWNSTHMIQSSTSWTSGVPIVYSVDGILKGVYNFTIIVFDTISNSANDTVFVTVTDTTNPQVDGPSSITFEIGEIGNAIEWSPSDVDPGTYIIYENGSQLDTASWNNGQNVTYGLDSLLAGNYEYIISIFDDSGNSLNHTVIVTVTDIVAPVLDTPVNIPFAEGSSGNIVVWTPTDFDPGTYIIYENGTQVDTSTWVSGVGINYNLDSLLKGTYDYTIILYDRSGNLDTHTVIITVSDETSPTLTNPVDFPYFEGETGSNINITWHTIDNYPVQLSIERDGTELYSFGWINDTDTIVIVDKLSAGTYNFTIIITDESGLIAIDTVWVTVVDNIAPVINNPADVTYTIGFVDNTIEWVGTDLHNSNYTVYNDTLDVIQTGFWISSDPIIVNIDGLNAGVHNYTIFLSDVEGNLVNDTVSINVTEESVFTDAPNDIYYTNTTLGTFFLNWTVSDSNEDWYILYRNNVSISNGNWSSGSPLSFNVDELAIGIYNFTLYINDTDGNEVTDIAWVTVSDIPDWDPLPPDIAYFEGTSGNNVNWSATDMFPDRYEIYNDTHLVDSGSWTSGANITLSLDGLLKGVYNYTIYIYDTVNNTISDNFTITVNDNTNPVMSTPPLDVIYDEGEINNIVLWNSTENYPDYYIIQNDTGHIVQTDTWISGEDIVFDVSGLPKGVFNFTITLFDESGNSISDTVQVVILDGTTPNIISPVPVPLEIGYSEDQIGNNLSWTASDNYADFYEIWNSTHLLNTSSWESGVAIVYNIDGFTKGTHNFTIIFVDLSRNNATHTVLVTVTDDTNPEFTFTPTDPIINEGDAGLTIIWRGTDNYTDTYIIYKDDVPGSPTSWSSGVDIVQSLNGLAKGSYNFTIVIFDVTGNSVTNTVIVTVNDGTLPILTDSPSNTQYAEGDTGNTLTWDATDTYADTYEIWDETNQLTNGSWISGDPVVHTIDELNKGTYNFTIIFIDDSNNWISHTVIFTVTDETLPILVTSPSNSQYAEGDIGNTLTWDATDAYNATYEIWNETVQLTNGAWNSGDPIIYNIDGYEKGIYNFTIIFIDESSNQINHTVIFTVTDETLPEIDHPINIDYLEGETNVTLTTITWTVSDKYADYYEIYNGSNLLINTTWTSGPISLDVSGSILGLYTYTIYIYDVSGNVVSDVIQVRVVERSAPIITYTPSPIQYNEETVFGKSLNWTAFDTYNDTYIIYQNGENIQSDFWNNGENITLNLDGLAKGTYNFTIVVQDSSLNSNKSMVWVTIVDELSPNLAAPPSNLNYESGDIPGNKITWTFIDNYADTYEIYHNGTLVDSGIWTSNRELDYSVDFDLVFGAGTDPLDVGFHNFTVVVRDKSGNQIIDTVIVEVHDTTSPIFTTFSVVSYEYFENSSGKQLNWTIFDENPNHYEILGNGTVSPFTSPWSSTDTTLITYNSLKYDKGIWNYTIIIYDDLGHFSIHTTIVTVRDIVNPTFLSTPLENEFTIIEGTQVNDLRWSMSDNHEDTYVMYINDVAIFSGTWISFQVYSFNINGLSTGFYNYTLFINDTSSNTFTSTMLITVEDQTFPIFNLLPTISNYTEGTTGHDLIWNIEEIHPHHYNITMNGILLINTTYVNNENIIWNIDNLEAGSYNFTIYFTDESNNVLFQTFILEVIDDTIPVIIIQPVDHTINETTTNNFLIWEATDSHAATYVFTQADTSISISGSWTDSEPIMINIDGFEPGFYVFKIEIFDESGNSVISSVTIRVKDPTITDTIIPIIEIENRVYEGDIEEFQGTWLTTPLEGNEGVEGGTIRIQLFQNLNRLKTMEVNTGRGGNYTILFDYTGLDPGNYTWKVSFLKDEYQEWIDIEIAFEVLPHTYSITIIIEDSIQQGRVFTIVAALKYQNNESENATLSLSEYTPISEDFTVAPDGVPVEFTIKLLYEDGTEKEIIKTAFTNENGIAKIELSEQDTTDLAAIISINVQVSGSDKNTLTKLEFNSQLPEVQAGAPTSIEIAIEFVRENIILLPILLATIVSLAIIGMQFNNRRVDRIRQINNAVKSAHVELQAIKSIESIIIQTSSKLTIYEEQVATSNINSTLIGGMVTAFSSFLDEVGKSELFGFEMMEREGLSLTLHQGKISNMIIISTDKLPIVLLSQIKDAQEDIEHSFKNNFTKTARGVTRLTSTEIHPKFHNAGFKLDLIDDLIFKSKNIKRMLRQRSLSRALKHNIRILYEFPNSEYFEGDTFKLNDIIEFFKSKDITERVSSRTIMLAYQFDVIETSQFENQEVE